MIVTTKSGSKYRIDPEVRTWERLQVTDKSGPLRTLKGSYLEIKFAVGQPLEMICPPLTPGTIGRYVATSKVTEIGEDV